MKYLYKYPQSAYPYANLVETNRRRSRDEFEYELLDTGIFNEDRYFDVYVEYAKESPEDILIRISVSNRGPAPATLHVLPTLWFRNSWSWSADAPEPALREVSHQTGRRIIAASHAELGDRWLYIDGEAILLFTENETNNQRLFGTANVGSYVKDGINNWLVHGQQNAVNPSQSGTKAASHHQLNIGAGQTATLRLRLSHAEPGKAGDPFTGFDQKFEARLREADDFYRAITPPKIGEDVANVMRQAFAGMLWSKQYYIFDADKWLEEHGIDPLESTGRLARNTEWFHMINDHVISMPDKWEYPWYAAWDLAFHAIALSGVDVDFAKEQLSLVLQPTYLHPGGQIPAYEWNFSDVNPPVHAWASIFLYRTEQAQYGAGDIDFLKRMFAKLVMNFNWWVNRKDRSGKSVFEGGFLGLDNISVFDRSAPLPTGGHLEQADGTAWRPCFVRTWQRLQLS